jgi:enediyne biosynthesis protein E4
VVVRHLPAIAAFAVFAALQPATEIRYPRRDVGVDTLQARRKAQIDAAAQLRVVHDFQFSDRIVESGITFVNRAVDDAVTQYKMSHYDHGTGIGVADVDGDGLYDILFVNQVGGNELWKNLGGGKFANATAGSGVALPDRISVGVAFGDIDNDGDQDLVITTVRGGNVLLENDGHGRFKDISAAAGVGLAAHSSAAVFVDYDGDGLLDLFVCNVGRYTGNGRGRNGQFTGLTDAFQGHLHPDRYEQPVLYRNMGHNTFADVTAATGLRPVGWSGEATFTDLNGDGRPDLLVMNMAGQQHFYENVDGKTFVDKSVEYFPRTPFGAMGVKFFDFDNDGRMDLLVTDMHSDMIQEVDPPLEKAKAPRHLPDAQLLGPASQFIFGNAFFHNRGGGRFEEISDRIGAENYWPWGPSVGDVNADGWDDVFIASGMGFPFRYGINSLLLNDRGDRFADAEFILGVEPRKNGVTHTPWFDMSCPDGAGIGPMPSPAELCRGTTGKVTIMATRSSRSAAIFDIDNDGDLDIVTNEFHAAPQVLVSDLAQRRRVNWIGVDLRGTVSNRNGLGAMVRVHANGRVFAKYQDGKSGYLSQSALPLYFGLGDSRSIDKVEVDWPSGIKQVETRGIRANQTLRVTERK